MVSMEEIQEQINALPNKYIFFTRKEIKRLPKIMGDNEVIRGLTSGYADGRTVLAVCTNRRVMMLDSGMFFGQRQRQMSLDRIQSILGNYVIFFGSLSISDGSSSMNMRMVLASSIDPFVKATHEATDEFRRIIMRENMSYVEPTSTEYVTDIATQLERLAALREKGVLTQEEFDLQKKKLLGK